MQELIGRGAFSKVKRVVRQYSENGVNYEDVFAMKVKNGYITIHR